jgi:hypothetical protein
MGFIIKKQLLNHFWFSQSDSAFQKEEGKEEVRRLVAELKIVFVLEPQ